MNNNMKKQVIRLTEGDLHRIIKESMNNVIKEYSRDIDDDNYYGGGLPDRYFDDNEPSVNDDFEGTAEWNKITNFIDKFGIDFLPDLTYDELDKFIDPLNAKLGEFERVMYSAFKEISGLKHEHIIKYMRETYKVYASLIFKLGIIYNKYKWLIQ